MRRMHDTVNRRDLLAIVHINHVFANSPNAPHSHIPGGRTQREKNARISEFGAYIFLALILIESQCAHFSRERRKLLPVRRRRRCLTCVRDIKTRGLAGTCADERRRQLCSHLQDIMLASEPAE